MRLICQRKTPKERVVFFNVSDDNKIPYKDKNLYQTQKFTTNYISTTKYNIIDFLPKVLILELSKISNIYFICIMALNMVPAIQIYPIISTLSPILFIFTLAIVKEAIENLLAYSRDKKENNKLCNILTIDGEIVTKMFKNVRVGDIVVLDEDEFVPADCLLLSCSEPSGTVYLETSSLDGEKAPKAKKVVKELFAGTSYVNEIWNLSEQLSFEVKCEIPSANLFKFKDSIVRIHDSVGSENLVSLSIDNFLFKGSTIKFSKSTLAYVLYTGKETKIQLNLEKRHPKISYLERLINRRVIVLLIIQFILALAAIVYRAIKFTKEYELNILGEYQTNYTFTFFQFFILLSNLIPISLFIYLEMLRFVQGLFVMWSDELRSDPEKKKDKKDNNNKGINCKVNSFTLNDELGRVQYILSDKTGTLTQNKLQMVGLFVNDKLWGMKESEQEDDENPRVLFERLEFSNEEKKYTFWDPDLYTNSRTKEEILLQNEITIEEDDHKYKISSEKDLYQEFFKALSLCHDCMILRKGINKNKAQSVYSRRSSMQSKRHVGEDRITSIHEFIEAFKYTGSSPDEIAILKGIRSMKYEFTGDFNGFRNIKIGKKNTEKYKIMLNFGFTSKRKCSSIIFQKDNGYVMYIKGADSKLSSIAVNHAQIEDSLIMNEKLSNAGYRILYYGMRHFSEKEYKAIEQHYHKIINKEISEDLDKFLSKKVEINVIYIGFIVLQDKLQNKVPETIHLLRNAGIKIWMITGDKLETAKSIAKSTNLTSVGDNVFEISKHEKRNEGLIAKKFDEAIDLYKKDCTTYYAFVIDMEQFNFEYLENHPAWLDVLLQAKTVVFSRTSPKLKGRICRLVKEKSSCVLAIGDGENDVNMINKAHVGIGIYGKEGTQATKVADFAIGEFKILWKLTIFSGRLNYLRTSNFVLIYLLKNFLFIFPQFIYGFLSAFSGFSIFDGWYISMFNSLLTTVPLFYIGITDVDIHYLNYKSRNKKYYEKDCISEVYTDRIKEKKGRPNLIQRRPIKDNYWVLYHESQLNFYFSLNKFIRIIGYALFISTVMMILAFQAFNLQNVNGKTIGYSELSICIYVFWIFALNISFVIRSYSFDIITILLIIFTSIIPLIIFMFIYDKTPNQLLYRVLDNTLTNVNFYFCLILMLCLYIIFELYYKSIFDAFEVPLYEQLEQNVNDEEELLFIKHSVKMYLDEVGFEKRKKSLRKAFL